MCEMHDVTIAFHPIKLCERAFEFVVVVCDGISRKDIAKSCEANTPTEFEIFVINKQERVEETNFAKHRRAIQNGGARCVRDLTSVFRCDFRCEPTVIAHEPEAEEVNHSACRVHTIWIRPKFHERLYGSDFLFRLRDSHSFTNRARFELQIIVMQKNIIRAAQERMIDSHVVSFRESEVLLVWKIRNICALRKPLLRAIR